MSTIVPCSIADLRCLIETEDPGTAMLFRDYAICGQGGGSAETVRVPLDERVIRTILARTPGYSRARAEWAAAYQGLAERLPRHRRLTMHGACIAWRGEGILFTAASGTGKSTHAKLWKDLLGDDVVIIINGDKPIVEVCERQAYVHGAPWAGKEGWQTKVSVPLRAIVLLHRQGRDHMNHAAPARMDIALPELMERVYLPRDMQGVSQALGLIDRLVRLVPMIDLWCDASADAVRCSMRALDRFASVARPNAAETGE